jgi:hypothetical protein
LLQFGSSYELGNAKKGENSRLKFEQMINGRTLADAGVNRGLFEGAYNEAAVYYFRKAAYGKVDEVLKSAQRIDPENQNITKLRMRYR